MKLDFLSPDQWKVILGLHSALARRLCRGFLACSNCHRREALTLQSTERYLRDGWPHCCEGTIAGGTMNYYASEKNFKKEQAAISGGA